MQRKISEKNISYLGVNPYKTLGKIIYNLRRRNHRNIITQEKLGELINLNRTSVEYIEHGIRKLDLFEVKDIANLFSVYSPEIAQLKLVLDTHFPKGNHGTRDIHKQTGILISKSRLNVGISRNELSRRTGIDAALLWRIESGFVRIYLLEVWAIARILRECEEFKQLDDALSDLLIVNQANQLVAS